MMLRRMGCAAIAASVLGCQSINPAGGSREDDIEVQLGDQRLCVPAEHFYPEQLTDSLELEGAYAGRHNLGRVDLTLFTPRLSGFNDEIRQAAFQAGGHWFLPDRIALSLFPKTSKPWEFDVAPAVRRAYEPEPSDDSGFRSHRKKDGCIPTGWPPADAGCRRDELKYGHALDPDVIFRCVNARCWMDKRLEQDGISFHYSIPRAYISQWPPLHNAIRARIAQWAGDRSCIRPNRRKRQDGENFDSPAWRDFVESQSLERRALSHYAGREYGQAEAAFIRTLALRENKYGPNHYTLTGTLEHLGDLYRRQGRFGEAEAAYQRRIGIELRLGARTNSVALALRSLASLHQLRGRYADAEQLYRAALIITEENWGATSTGAALASLDLAGVYEAAGQFAAAEPLYLRAARIYDNVNASPEKLKEIYGKVAAFYKKQGRLEEAARIAERANRPRR